MHRATGEVADLVVHADQSVAAGDADAGTEWATTPGTIPSRSVNASERVPLHQCLCLAFEESDFVLPNEGVPTDEVGGAIGPAHLVPAP